MEFFFFFLPLNVQLFQHHLVKGNFLSTEELSHFCYKSVEQGSPGGSWIRIHLPLQESRVRYLGREDSTCRGATKLMGHCYGACALEPRSCNY